MSWATDILFETVKASGTLVPPEVAIARIHRCETLRFEIINGKEVRKPCEYVGIVKPLPFVKARGCTKCKCPFDTKPLMDTFFNPFTMQIEKIECPHEDGNMWAEADKLKI